MYAVVRSDRQAQAIQEQAEKLPQLMRPVVVTAPLGELPHKLASLAPNVCFDSIVGRNALTNELDKVALVQQLVQLLQPSGVLVLAENLTRHTQRLYRLLDASQLDAELSERLAMAEEEIYANSADPMKMRSGASDRKSFSHGFAEVTIPVNGSVQIAPCLSP